MFLCLALWSIGQVVAEPLTLEAIPRALDDGDTFILHFRSQGIDTPEKAQQCARADGSCYDCGQDAKAALDEMIVSVAGRPRCQVLGRRLLRISRAAVRRCGRWCGPGPCVRGRANGGRTENLARARELLDLPQPNAKETEPDTEDDQPTGLAQPCPCCGGPMIVMETFQPGCPPRAPRPSANRP